jgi:hypothetical protein
MTLVTQKIGLPAYQGTLAPVYDGEYTPDDEVMTSQPITQPVNGTVSGNEEPVPKTQNTPIVEDPTIDDVYQWQPSPPVTDPNPTTTKPVEQVQTIEKLDETQDVVTNGNPIIIIIVVAILIIAAVLGAKYLK